MFLEVSEVLAGVQIPQTCARAIEFAQYAVGDEKMLAVSCNGICKAKQAGGNKVSSSSSGVDRLGRAMEVEPRRDHD